MGQISANVTILSINGVIGFFDAAEFDKIINKLLMCSRGVPAQFIHLANVKLWYVGLDAK
jgi:hypothetical protein